MSTPLSVSKKSESKSGKHKSRKHHKRDPVEEKSPISKKHRNVEIEDPEENPLMDSIPLESVMKIYASLSEQRWESPWQVGTSDDVSGSGFCVLNDKFILTNAHVVEQASYITVKKFGSSESVPATIVCISYHCDLALLELYKDEEFKDYLDDVKPLEFAKNLPFLQDEVLVVGYPEGGDNISATRGIVSRVEPTEYTPAFTLLAVQIDAAVNHGNSGGPVFKKDKVIGVAFSGLDHADGIGYIIPSTIVTHFLNEYIETKQFRGFCSLGFDVQNMENKRMRQAYLMAKGVTGLLVKHVDPMACTAGLIQSGDVLTSFDGVKISNDGSVRFRKRELIHYDYLVQQKYPGTTALLGILRNGEPLEISVTLSHLPEMVKSTKAEEPRYVCWAGLVFVPLTFSFMDAMWGDDWDGAPSSLIKAAWSHRNEVDQEYVVLARILADDINYGYDDLTEKIVTTHNGVKVRNLKHLHELLTNTKSGLVRIELHNESILVLDAEEAHKKNPTILKKHKIPTMTNLT